jgi:hypothetical protein
LLAQTPLGPTPHTPDLLGLYPGMPARDARTQLQKHSANVNVTSDSPPNTLNLIIPDPMNRDMVRVYLTVPPTDPAVWMIQRSQVFAPQNPMSQNALLTALREKYGKETLTNDKGGGGLYVYWIYDQSGKLLTAADAGLAGCSGNNFVNYVSSGPPPMPNTIEQACFRSFFAVIAMLNRRDAQILESYQVDLVNLPYAFKAATVVADANRAAADQARRNQLDKADRNKPKF